MSSELLAAASEIRLQLAANSVDKALRAACEGLKRFLNDPRPAIQASHFIHRDPNGKVQVGDIKPYVHALEQVLEAADVDALTTQYLLDNLQSALAEISAHEAPNEETRIAAFRKALHSQQIVCTIPMEAAQHKPLRRNLTKGLVSVVGVLAAAGGVALLASPVGLAALFGAAGVGAAGAGAAAGGAAGVAAVLNLALGHIFGKAADSAWSALQQVQELQPALVICKCCDKKD